jgi:hypothetical protein
VKRLLVVALVVTAGCGVGTEAEPAAPSTAIPSTSAAMPAFLRVTGRPAGSLMAVVWRNGVTTITSKLAGTKVTISGRAGRYTKNGRVLAVAKTYKDGVRLKSARGRTLWRVKMMPRDEVQIRHGETDIVYEFHHYNEERINVRKGTLLVGSVRAIEQGAQVIDAQGIKLGMSSSPPGNDMAVLLCSDMPPDLRAILTAVMVNHR